MFAFTIRETDEENIQKLILLFLTQTLWCDHSFESSRRDDSNECHNIGFYEKKCKKYKKYTFICHV